MATPGFTDMAVVSLHPYGNARESPKQNSTEWDFTCQHGPIECVYNQLEACALDQVPAAQQFDFIKCIELNDTSRTVGNYSEVANKCATEAKVEGVDKLLTCMNGPAGNALEHKIALATEALKPAHQYVPWLVADGVHTDAIQNAVGSNLLGYVCKTYKGAKKAAACNDQFVFSDEDIDVCYKDDIFTETQQMFLQ